MRHFLDFEKPIAELEGKIEELRRMSEPDGINITEEIARRVESELQYPGQIKVVAIREKRASDIAR